MSKLKRRLSLFCLSLLGLNLLTGLFFFSSDTELATALAAEGLGSPAHDFVIGQGAASPFGLNVQSAARWGKPGSFATPLGKASETGAGWNREELRWDILQPCKGPFNYTFFDDAINTSISKGLNVIGILNYNLTCNGNDSGTVRTLPDLTQWQNYVSAVVGRYKDKVKYWEIWNEPSDPDYLSIPDFGQRAAGYAQLLSRSYDTIKRLDSSAKIITGGVSSFDVPFLEEVMRQGGAGKYDILGVHPYVNFPTSPERKYWADTDLVYFLNFAARQGNKPVWATEYGWSNVGSYAVDQNRQANNLARSTISGLAAGLQKMLIYEFHDNSADAGSRYGLVGTDWTTPKPAFNVYKNLITRLSGSTFKQRFELYDGNRSPIEGFENGNPFGGGFANPPSTLNASQSVEQTHSGSASLKFQYDFRGNSANYIEVGRDFPLSGQPTKLGVWIYGDGQGAKVRFLIKDASGKTLTYEVGNVGTAGWQRREAWLQGERSDGSSGPISYPIRFTGIQIYSAPDGAKWGGTIYLDDVYAASGANAQAYRFERNGVTIDALWADDSSGSVALPTNSGTATVYDKNGGVSQVNASNGNLNLNIGEDMIFVEHQGKPLSGSSGGGGGGGGGGVQCGSPISNVSQTNTFPNDFFRNFWLRYDFYAVGARSYVWGEKPFATGNEPYYQALDGNAQNTKVRQVLYFDKSRMEITRVSSNPNAAGYVTNGLLTVELVTGKVQTGDDQGDPLQFQQCTPAQVPVAGDPDDTSGPKYASLAARRNDAAKGVGAGVTETIDSAGNLGSNPALGGFGVTGGYFEPLTNHTIAKPFWDFLNDPSQKIFVNGQAVIGKLFNPYYEAPGLPITEAYWAKVKVAGEVKDVLIQAFERRVLTYTPTNPAAFKVEWGNIGRHYFSWRYNANFP